MKRMLIVVVLAVMPIVGGAACGGDGDTPADRVTQPIDKAEDTADVANQREADLESKLAEP